MSELKDCEGVDGEAVSMSCEFSSPDNDISTTWYKDDEIIKPSKDVCMTWSPPIANLEIKELLYPDDDGTYRCVATNKQGKVSSTARLTVKGEIIVVFPGSF